MADDMSQVESTLASTERLIARLVALYEQGGSGVGSGGVHVQSGGSGSSGGGQQQQPTLTPAEKAAKDAEAATKALETKAADARAKLKSDVNRVLTTVGNIAGVVNNNFARLETAGALALASQTGTLTWSQTASQVTTQLTGAARNITQFGFVAGGLLSAVDAITAVMSVAQKKVELRVAKATRESDAQYARELAMRKITDGSTTTQKMELEAAVSAENRAKARMRDYEAIVAADKSARPIGDPRVTSRYSTGYGKAEKLVKASGKSRADLKVEYSNDKAKVEELRKAVIDAQAAYNEDEAKTARAKTLQNLSLQADKDLRDLSLKNKSVNYQATVSMLEAQEALYRKEVHGKTDKELVDKIVEGQKQIQKAKIESIKQDFATQELALERNAALDSKGNVVAEALRLAKIALQEKMFDAIKSTKTVIDLAPFKLTPADTNAVNKAISDINEGMLSAIDGSKSDRQSLDFAKASAQDEDAYNALKLRNEKAAFEANKRLKLARERIAYGAVDPLRPVNAQIEAAASELARLRDELSKSTGKSKADLTASIAAQELVIRGFEEIDKPLAKRAEASLRATKQLELLELRIDASSERAERVLALRARDLEQVKRQLAAAGAAPGSVSNVINEAANAALERKADEARSALALYEKQLASAVVENADAKDQLELEKKVAAARKSLKSAVQNQAIALAEQAANATYLLDGDKPGGLASRSGRIQRIGNGVSRISGLKGGSESARLTSDFNEMYRLQRGKLTDEEKAAAKEERRLNLQLDRARAAIARGSGSTKQHDLVQYYNSQKGPKADVNAKLESQMEEANGHLAAMSQRRRGVTVSNAAPVAASSNPSGSSGMPSWALPSWSGTK